MIGQEGVVVLEPEPAERCLYEVLQDNHEDDGRSRHTILALDLFWLVYPILLKVRNLCGIDKVPEQAVHPVAHDGRCETEVLVAQPRHHIPALDVIDGVADPGRDEIVGGRLEVGRCTVPLERVLRRGAVEHCAQLGYDLVQSV